MYLSKLQIIGFKSFANKITLDFNTGTTCVIGPNGSGKSNIVDAMRWVLGEQKVSLLRSDKMESVIFNGTKTRKPMGMAEVSLTIENNKKVLNSAYSEIVVSRRLYRSGESQYLINKVPVRLRDVIDLFMDTGMGANSYSVIELKMVESILSDNKQERRLLFEEAAGVVKYKTRRKSALRKLETTQLNLSRVSDIINEVDKTVSSLKRQVGKARRYLDYTEQLKKNELDLAVYRYHHLLDAISPLEQELTMLSQEKEKNYHQITIEEALLEDYDRQGIATEQRLQELNKQLYNRDNAIRQLNQEDAVSQTKIEEMRKNNTRYHTEISEYEQKIIALKDNQNIFQHELTDLETNREAMAATFQTLSTERDEQAQRIEKEKTEIERLNQDFRIKFQNLGEKKEAFQQKEYRHSFAQEQIEKIKNTQNELSQEISSLEAELQTRQLSYKSTETHILEATENLKWLSGQSIKLQEKLTTGNNTYNQRLSEIERLHGRIGFFKNSISSYEGHSASTQFIMSQKQRLPGIYGAVSEIIETDTKYVPLVESILGSTLNYIVVETDNQARELIGLVRREKKGRITSIPLERVNSIPLAKRVQRDGSINFLLDHINCAPKFENLLYILLGDVAVCDSLDEALKQSQDYPQLQFITHDSEVVRFNREVSGGEKKGNEHTIIGRKQKLEELEKELFLLEAQLGQLENDLAETKQEQKQNLEAQHKVRQSIDNKQNEFYQIKNVLSKFSYQLDTKQKQQESAASQLQKYQQEINGDDHDITVLRDEIDSAQRALNDLEREVIKRSNAFENQNEEFQMLSGDFQQLQLKLSDLNNQINNRKNDLQRSINAIADSEEQIKRRKQEIEDIKTNVEQLESDISQRKAKREQLWEERDNIDKKRQAEESVFQEMREKKHALEEQIKEFRRKHDNSLEKTKKLEIQINERQYRAETLRGQMTREYSIDIDALLPNDNLDEHETEEAIESLKSRILHLGAVNPLAVSEYEKENERLQFLKSQFDDLQKAEHSLMDTIDKINKTARTQFIETFEAIKVNFEKVFKSFFATGTGTIRLADDQDPLEADIDIEVTTKGRSLQTLSLLSGGEKTLTAISLLFSIYLVKPSPFCILDEVDAPLDDMNIGRFTEALKSFSDNTQFIVVTHNKSTMEAAKNIYGVTMEEEGVSKIVSVNFN